MKSHILENHEHQALNLTCFKPDDAMPYSAAVVAMAEAVDRAILGRVHQFLKDYQKGHRATYTIKAPAVKLDQFTSKG